MIFVSPPKAIKLFYDELIWNFPTNEKIIYLTFDDGPIPVVTPWVLQKLKEYNAKATFFCIGENVKKHPEVFKQIINAEHSIGNHTYNHLNGWKTKTEIYIDNIKKCEEEFELNSENRKPLFRPPYGLIKKTQINRLSSAKHKTQPAYSIIMWDVLSYDFDNNIPPEKILENVISKTKPGSIIVFHDSTKAEKNLRFALPQVLKYFSDDGFSFQKINHRPPPQSQSPPSLLSV